MKHAAILVLLAAFAPALPARAQSGPSGGSDAPPAAMFTVTSANPEARKSYEQGLVQREDLLYVEEGISSFRKAVQADPHFALGYATLAFYTGDSQEEAQARAESKRHAKKASPDERLLMSFMNSARENDLVAAIAAMNELLGRYPKDKRLANMYGEWLMIQPQNYERAEVILQRALDADPDYAPALNNLAYAYAFGGKLDKFAPLMDRYVALWPAQPNPQDSYGELWRMAGNFPAALEHYGAALKIDPKFTSSQIGIASTYALMGNEKRARAEYLKGIKMSQEKRNQLTYKSLWAMTWYREGNPERSRQELQRIAQEAHNSGLAAVEAEAYRAMTLFALKSEAAWKDLAAADAVLSEKHELSGADRDAEIATIARTRAYVAARSGQPDQAAQAVKQLAPMAQKSTDNGIQTSYHAANGGWLFAQGKFAAAADELQYDPHNPLSLQLLAEAQSKGGKAQEAQKSLAALAAICDERVETAVGVPAGRAALKASAAARR